MNYRDVKLEKISINNVIKSVKRKISRKTICYVLITCNEPEEDGYMDVEMCYDGDTMLASYLVHSAQSAFTE